MVFFSTATRAGIMDQPHVEIYVSGHVRNERKSIAPVLPQTLGAPIPQFEKLTARGRICVHPALLRVATAIGSSIDLRHKINLTRAVRPVLPMRTPESSHQWFDTKEDWI